MNKRKINTRRPKHTQDELRELILEAATKLIDERGLEALSAREVARQIGYSPGTLYNVFKDRDEIILTIQSRLLDKLAVHLDAVQSTRGDRERVVALADSYLAFTQAYPKQWNLLFEHRLIEGKPTPDWYQEKIDGLMTRVEAALGPLAGEKSPTSMQLSARVLWAGVHGITSLSTAGKLASISNEAAQTLVTNLVSTYLDGLTGPASKPAQRPPKKSSGQSA
ncbi:MAG: TetR/AcrR family transcriptional regulator [Alphaproteobacteria bacterium]|nr:TetR/AcrR family transcriptional regulator [Alphaproteobacteria bacterium]